MSFIFYNEYSEDQLEKCMTENMKENICYWQNKIIPIVYELGQTLKKLPKHIDVVGQSDICRDGSNHSVILFRSK
jgi:hypothetical protein